MPRMTTSKCFKKQVEVILIPRETYEIFYKNVTVTVSRLTVYPNADVTKTYKLQVAAYYLTYFLEK